MGNDDIDEIVDEVRVERELKRKILYLREDTYQDFAKLCGDVSVSAVVQKWMQRCLDAVKNKKKGKK